MFHLIKQRTYCFPSVNIMLFDLWPHRCVYHMSSAVQIRLIKLHQLLSSQGPRSALYSRPVGLTALGLVPSRLYGHTDSDPSLITLSVTPLFSYRLFIRWPKVKCISWPKTLSLVFIFSKTFFPDQCHHAETDGVQLSEVGLSCNSLVLSALTLVFYSWLHCSLTQDSMALCHFSSVLSTYV